MKKSRGIVGYVALLGTLLLIAILLNGGLNQTVSKRIEYPQLLDMIEKGKVARVAIRNNSLVGLTKNTQVSSLAFPESDYDFETTIGSDFWDTVRIMEAQKRGVDPGLISIHDLSFDIQYRAPVTIPWWYEFLPYVIMLVLMAAFWMFMLRAQGGGSGRGGPAAAGQRQRRGNLEPDGEKDPGGKPAPDWHQLRPLYGQDREHLAS